MHVFNRVGCLLFIVLAILGPARGLRADDTGGEIKKMTGRHTRVVWVQDAGPTACVYVEKPTVLLMGLDSDDGKGERAIVAQPNSFYKPLLTADGQRVVYSDRVANTVCVVPFAGGTPQVLVHDAEAEDVWTDPEDGVEWVYARETRNQVLTVVRYRMDNLKISEVIWDKTPAENFQISGDGEVASGSSGISNSQGIFWLPNDSYASPTGGCWPAMSPDDSHRFWVFGGTHREIGIFTPMVQGEAKFSSFGVNVATAPGIPSNVEVYHPRWSNNVRFMTITGPYARFDWTSDAKITNEVAAGVEVYLGRFSEDLHQIEQWVQVTHNQRGDYFPDAWIEPEPGAAVVKHAPVIKSKPKAVDEGLQYLFSDVTGSNQVPDTDGKRIRICAVKLTGKASYGRYGVIQTSASASLASDAEKVIQACQTAGAFSFSCTITPAAFQINDPATLVSFSDASGKSDFGLVQTAGRLLARLATSTNGTTVDLGEITPERALHVSINFAAGKLRCYLDGKRVLANEEMPGDLKGWTAKTISLGASADGTHGWMGSLCDIAIRSRVLDDAEAATRAAAAAERAKARVPADRIVVEGVLDGHTAPADPKAIAPYTRCLSLSTYEVKNVVEGKLDAKKIAVLQWSVMDSQRVPEYAAIKPGDSRRMVLELFSDHPEQEPERQTNEVEGTDALPLYYDVAFAVPAAPAGSDVHWTGNSGLWSAASSWSKPGVPSALDRVTLDPVAGAQRLVTIDQPVMIGALTIQNPTATSVNGLVVKAPLSIGGSTPPVLTLSGPGSLLRMVGAPLKIVGANLGEITLEGTAEFTGDGGVSAVHVDEGGSKYITAPQVTFTGTGTGATGQATLSVSSIRVTHLGNGYTTPPTITFSEPETAVGKVANGSAILDAHGSIDHININDGGSGYLEPPTITIDGGGGSGGQASSLCRVSGVSVISRGSGYTTPPAVTFEGGGGSGAKALANTQETVIATTDAAGAGMLMNKGKLIQDGAFLVLDRVGQGDQKGNEGFRNEGTWMIGHGGLDFNAPGGLFADKVAPCANTGTMVLLDDSSLTFGDLTNTGTLKIGAGVKLSSPVFAGQDIAIHNSGKGVLSITGGTPDRPVLFGFVANLANGQRRIFNGGADSSAVLEIGDGKDGTTVVLTGGGSGVENAAGSRMALRHGASLKMLANDSGAPNNFTTRPAYVTNHGLLEMGGSMVISGNQWGPMMLENDGTLVISGDGATFDREKDPSLGLCTGAAFINHDKGTITGEGIFSYVNNTNLEREEPRAVRLAMLMAGTIAPRNLNGKTNAPATLTFVGVDMIMGCKAWLKTDTNGIGLPPNDYNNGGTFTLHLTGGNGECDQVIIKQGTGATKAGSLTLTAGEGSTLDLRCAPGVIPRGNYIVVLADAIKGQFDHLLYEGKDQVPYTVKYSATSVEVDFP